MRATRVSTSFTVAALVMSVVFSGASAEGIYTVRLVAKDGYFHPETIKVPADRRFKLIIANEGTTPEEFESTELKKEKVLAPGATSFLVFAPLKPGVYSFFGEFHPATAKGRIVAE